MFDKKTVFLLLIVFVIALSLRFIYFPDNIYFGFDQARDMYAVSEIISGNIKLIGPPTTYEGLHHGSLYYYLYAPFYLIGGGNPEVVAAFLRVVNALGIFLIFTLAAVIFNKYVGLLAAFLFAISFEQTQFALYLNHPSLAVISILIMYLGLAILIFKKRQVGLVIALIGLGLSVQFEFLLTYLIVPFILILALFRRSIPPVRKKIILLGLFSLFITVLTFLIAEIKFSFRSYGALQQLLFSGDEKSLTKIIPMYLFEMGQVIKFSLISFDSYRIAAVFVLIGSFLFLLKSQVKKQILFLGIWFFSAMIVYFVSGGGDLNVDIIQYHPNVGISLALIIFVSYLLYILGKKNYLIPVLLLLLISFSNFSLIQKINPFGSMPEINAQSFMLLSDQKKVLDFIYMEAQNKPFAVKGITLPFYINTTWSYLFSWYGLQKYGYQPIWNGKNALGFPGSLKVEDSQDKSPEQRFLIIEPIRGIPQHLINEYLKEEDLFSAISKEEEIGKFKVQVRHKK